ncbi:MAG: Hpt domain-containing protein [Pseudomonadota bacterium]
MSEQLSISEEQIPGNALAIVSAELMETIRGAHLALEDCVDGRGGSAALTKAADLLHQVRGALQITETYGAALLAEEMESASRYLASLRAGKGREDGLDALTRAMVQLPSYVERLLAGGRDIALVLLPILNDLRAARGEPLLSEGTLLLLNLSPSRASNDRESKPENEQELLAIAKRLRPKYQLALLGWIKGGDSSRHLETLTAVAGALENAAHRDDVYQLWWVVGGVLESLQNGGLETSVALKRLLGQTDRQIKLLIDEGANAFDTHPVEDLLNNLLYYVARSSAAGERIGEIRAAFNLAELLPGDDQVEHAREALSAPSVKMMETVAAAIKEDLGRVKDVLDIFVRTGMNKPSELVPQLELLKKISDTLGVLGLGELRSDIDAEIDRLRAVVERDGGASDQIILDIASTLLRVEDRLDQQLIRLTVPGDAPAAMPTDGMEPNEAADYQQVAESVMRECIINLARVKETVSQSLAAQAPSQGLDSVPSLIRGIRAGLMMLDKTRAMEVIDRIGEFITLALNEGAMRQLGQRETDRLADAIVSIEYYMETVKVGRAEPWYMLDNAEACLAVLRDVGERLGEASEPAAPAEPEVAAPPPPVEPPPVVSEDKGDLDPELLELFIEEAGEEVASIKQNLPAWANAPDDMETLISVRRSFHTLKGSGRMVGAERVGEYCWSIENLLNRLINRTLVRTPPMVQFILDAANAVPELIEQLEVGTEPQADIPLLMVKANAFAEGDPNAADMQLDSPTTADSEPEPKLEMDPVLLDIYSKETAGHLSAIKSYLDACEGDSAPFDVTEKLHRACHTLHGSANMANVERSVAVGGALNRYVRRIYDYKVGFDDEGLKLLRRAAHALATIVSDINQPDRERKDYNDLVARLLEKADEIQPDGTVVSINEQVTETADEPEAELAANAAVEEVAEYDAEIASIFAEESAELLESIDSAFDTWRGNHDDAQSLDALKRDLHTLKGGARTAGITAMGNLSHEIETLLISLGYGSVQGSNAVDELLLSSIDELHRMRDLVIATRPVPAARELERRIQQANAGQAVAAADPSVEEASIDVEQAEPASFSPEPDDTVSMVILDSPLDNDLAEIAFSDVDSEEQDAMTPEPAPAIAEQAEAAEPVGETAAEGPADAEPVTQSPVESEPESEHVPDAEPDSELEPEPELAAASDAEPVDSAQDDDVPAVVATAAEAPPLRTIRAADTRQEFARVDAELLENLLNAAGEVSIYHSRLNQQINTFEFHVEEIGQTVQRLRDQLRKLEIETEAQIMAGHQETLVAKDFDPLEMDRYSTIQQLSRALAESANDLDSLRDLLTGVTREAESLLVQQSRVTAELQDGLMRTRMVPFERHVSRLTRLVRQQAGESGKRAELAVEGASGELDRQVLEKMLPPFEHMLRNAVVHGIETPENRIAAGKPAVGRITIRLHREGAEMVIDVADDGAGLDVNTIRRKATELGMLSVDSDVKDAEIMDLILTPGFSTAGKVTQSAGRGVGMDVVANEIKKLGGSLAISSVTGQGTNFTVRLPFTLAITQALIVRTGDEVYALPLPSVEGVARIPRAELENLLSQSEPSYQYGEQTYRFRHLGMYIGGKAAQLPEDEASVPVILIRAGEFSAALLTDEMLASQEIVVKSVGPQLSGIRGVAGATILGDGRIVLILDINALVRTGAPVVELKSAAPAPTDDRPLALVVDDSITVRRVTERFLQRHGLRVLTAKDGLDAIAVMSDHKPDIILLDIEMPRMDGYEFASHVRNDDRVADVPIIMITSRVGDKHRARAIELGVNDYLGKPYQDNQLMEAIQRQLEDRGIELK